MASSSSPSAAQTHRITIPLTDEENDMVAAVQAESGMGKADFYRSVFLRAIQGDPEEEGKPCSICGKNLEPFQEYNWKDGIACGECFVKEMQKTAEAKKAAIRAEKKKQKQAQEEAGEEV